MRKLAILFLFYLVTGQRTFSQNGKLDSLFSSRDTTAILDSLMKDFDDFLDSLANPKSFFNVSVGVGTGLFSFENANSVFITTEKKLMVSPSLGYYHRSGLGFSVTAFMINEDRKVNFYQYSLGPSYDVIKTTYSTGAAYTRYVNKDSLSFYTTPIKNEMFGYFSYKKWCVRPTVSVSYGWGNKTEYEKRKFKRLALLSRQSDNYYILIKNEESVQDLSLTVSVRKDFDWYNVFGKNDNITLTPVVLLNSGTQNFGFNTSYTYSQPAAIRINSSPSNSNISDRTNFAPQSLSVVLRGSYLKGKFLLQPQILLDYYLPQADDRFNSAFSITAGFSF